MNMEKLKKEIAQRKKEIHSDSYPMSIGEVINLYRDGELEIRPEFQRFFRWTDQQKTTFIESILLGIPLPSFFVSQRDDGVWEVVDGLQRLSTIFQFVGELKDENENKMEELNLQAATYLKELDGFTWSKLDKSLQIDFKREKIDFKIIKKESTPDTKYDLFQRLNTGGTSLSDQEVRNCILIMINKDFYHWIEDLSQNPVFQEAVPLSENQIAQRYDLDLITRFLVFLNMEPSRFDGDVGSFLTEQITKIAKDDNFDLQKKQEHFEKVFSLLKTFEGDAFRKYDCTAQKHKGAFSLTLYEAIVYGLGKNIASYDAADESIDYLRDKIQKLPNEATYKRNSGTGTAARTRFPNLLPFAEGYFVR